jgi:hypothetical protein
MGVASKVAAAASMPMWNVSGGASSPRGSVRGQAVVSHVLLVAVALAAGASCSSRPIQTEGPTTPAQPSSDQQSQPVEPPAATQPAIVDRLEPRGSPRPAAVCGHAVALAGWRSGRGGDDMLLIHDPADNRATGSGRGAPPHDWRPQPLELPVRYGAGRPGVVLTPNAAYTVVGAVVVAPTAADRAAAELAAAMPDLSQEFPGRGPGLCGPTAAADILYAIASGRPAVLAGRERGPAANGDVASLVLDDEGLAGLMGIGAKDDGATNDGIRAGLEAWLETADPDAWSVSLDWLEDEPRPREAQRRFLDRLATAAASGGGVVLCLWPGHDSTPTPAAAPEIVSAAEQARPDGAAAARAVTEAKKSLDAARRSLARGRPGEAVEAAGKAVAAVRRQAITDSACRQCLDEALALTAEIDRVAAAAPPRPGDKPTQFE